jgi:2-isopropylmalate synthase
MTHIAVFDTTLRDGEQSPGCSMTLAEKLRLAPELDLLGVDVIEAGFPMASQGDFESVRAVARVARNAGVAALCRAGDDDIECAARALEPARRPRLHIFLATSDLHLQFKLRKSRHEVQAMADRAVRLARKHVDEVEFSAEDATRSDVAFLADIVRIVVEAGATVINIPDTVGYATPPDYAALMRAMGTVIREASGAAGAAPATLSAHCHNDLGLAVANTIAALEAGATQVECTINGIGERAGNAALEEVVMACAVRGDRLPFTTNIRTERLYPTSRLLSEIIQCPVQPNKAIVGRNAFAHEAGIHQHGVMSNPLCYEIMTPESVGAEATRIVLGKHSGRHALARRYEELGAPLSPGELDDAYARFIALADRKKRVYDQDLLAIAPRSVASR